MITNINLLLVLFALSVEAFPQPTNAQITASSSPSLAIKGFPNALNAGGATFGLKGLKASSVVLKKRENDDEEDVEDEEGGDTDSLSGKRLVRLPKPKASQSFYAPNDPRRFSRPLSEKAAKIYARITEVAKDNPDNTPTPPDLIGASGRFLDQLAEYGNNNEFCQRIFSPMITKAQTEVLISTFIFDRDTPTSSEITQAIIQLNKIAGREKRKVRVWMVIDTIGAYFFSHEMPALKSLRNVVTPVDPKHYKLPRPEEVPNLDFQVRNSHKLILGAMHTKMVLIDGKYTIMGSKNLDGDSCMEYVYAMEGSVTASMRADFQDMWREHLPSLPELITEPRPIDVPVLVMGRVEGRRITSKSELNPQDSGWLAAMDAATSQVYIQTPNFVVERMAKKVLETVRRGISVTIITAYSQQDFNEKIQRNSISDNRGTAKWMYKELKKEPSAKERLKVCWFIGYGVTKDNPKPTKEEWSHIKAMFIDKEIAIIGSGNQDPQSWYHSRENNLLIDDAQTSKTMLAELLSKQKSLTNCYGPEDKFE